MKILNQDFTTITFNDVTTHCEEKHPEGVQLDYKENYPQKDLSKLFAAFSNTRGGLIIIGVKEDRTTGVPEQWNGIALDASLIERVHQQALSVTPLPSYQVRFTDENEGKAYLLIRIDEGDSTPYFVKNDSNVWGRTGNIKNPIDNASPEWLDLLYKKRERADKARKNYIGIAKDVFQHGLEREERKRLKLIEEAKKKGDGGEKEYYQNKLGTETELCTIYLQPYFPRKALITPKEILDNLQNFRSHNNFVDFLGKSMTPIPEGLFSFSHSYRGYVECQQIYSTGLIFDCFDVLSHSQEGKPIIYISHILGALFALLLSARSFYNQVGYQGVIKLRIELPLINKNKDINFFKITSNNLWFYDECAQEALLSKYEWEFTLETSQLNNPEEAFKEFYEISKEIHWYLGFDDLSIGIIEKFMKEGRMIF